MSNTVIKVENLSKQYRLGSVGTGSLAHDINKWWHSIRGKENPYLKIGETNDRTSKGNSEYVWSLKDVNFEIQQGDAVGIIGRNGAGKSTLLKILSRVTAPTAGSVKVKGRVASLLEVGTGFHPELTGRENIFLNGAILGLRKKEIASKFDEIVDFAGVERYIDTPVKRYSSGMYVRLAFAVAAHLDSEILIIDEVLAVGDAEFQKKCLGKMGEISKGEGRTILFVSHNLTSIKQLCDKGILMNRGVSTSYDKIKDALENYQHSNTNFTNERNIDYSKDCFIVKWYIDNGSDKNNYFCYTREIVNIRVEVILNRELEKAELGFIIRSNSGDIIFSCNSRDFKGSFTKLESGTYLFNYMIRLPLKSDTYFIDVAVADSGVILDHWISPIPLKILSDYEGVLSEKWAGLLNEEFKFSHEKVD